MHLVEDERLLVKLRLPARSRVFPRSHIRIDRIVSQGFVVGSLALFAEMAPARFTPMEGVEREQFSELEVIGDTPRVLEALVEVVLGPGYRHVVPELVTELRNALQRRSKARFVARHPDVIPQQRPQLAVELADALAPPDDEQLVDPFLH